MDDLVTWLCTQIAELRASTDDMPGLAECDAFDGVHLRHRDVLAHCEAHEAILKLHNAWAVVFADDNLRGMLADDRHCVGCGFDAREEYETPDVNDCPTLRAVALAYQHRPGYREEWRP